MRWVRFCAREDTDVICPHRTEIDGEEGTADADYELELGSEPVGGRRGVFAALTPLTPAAKLRGVGAPHCLLGGGGVGVGGCFSDHFCAGRSGVGDSAGTMHGTIIGDARRGIMLEVTLPWYWA